MNVLIACEESQRVCTAFRERGHRAFSCDIQPCSGGHPEWHILGDVLPILNGNCCFTDEAGGQHEQAGRWDLIIAHPPCTHLASSGARWFPKKRADGRQTEAIRFFMKFVSADADKIAIENPIGIMSTEFRKPDQIIQPYYFGDHARKSTCLWLKGLPPLEATDMVDPGKIRKGGFSYGASLTWATDENGKIIPWNDPRTAVIRSKTFTGIALAMAEQWG